MLCCRNLAQGHLEMIGICSSDISKCALPSTAIFHTIKNVHQVSVERVLVGQNREACHDLAELFAACLLCKPVCGISAACPLTGGIFESRREELGVFEKGGYRLDFAGVECTNSADCRGC